MRVPGLVEWPVVLMGSFDESFLSVPPEVIATSIKNHQKCFALRNATTGKLANRYLLVSNLVAKDGGKTIIAGNNKVIAARLSDAKFFWDQDRKQRLEEYLPKLAGVVFHAKLGTQAQRVDRIASLAAHLAPLVGAVVGIALVVSWFVAVIFAPVIGDCSRESATIRASASRPPVSFDRTSRCPLAGS